MRYSFFILSVIVSVLFTACIGDDFIDDFVEPVVRLTTIVDNMEEGTTFQFEADYFNNIGVAESAAMEWSSSNPAIISITNDGFASALAMGTSDIKVSVTKNGETVEAIKTVAVTEEATMIVTSRDGTLQTTSSYLLQGDFILEENDQQELVLSFSDNYAASTALPGLYVYLSNNPNTTSGAHEIGAVEVFNGEHSYTIDSSIDINDYGYVLYFCKPFNVKVGDGALSN